MRLILTGLLLFIGLFAQAQLQSPSDFLGYTIGTEFSRHADVVRYFEHVASNSDMVTYHQYGKTNERRPLTYAIVSTSANLAKIEQIRTDNLKSIGLESGSAQPDVAIVWLSYNVHGNEASSTEASMQTLYELITQKKAWLENTVVIIDPCINPDGRDRYANWYNQVKATPYNSAQIATEHNEPWPGGRPNHYLFDLNRDWAWASQVETQQRLVIYNQWMPHVHVDFHEQGINEPYYFAPAAEPYHEIISPWQREFQTQIGKNHAKYFDAEGWLFFTRERFDLLYPSYGDTYPTYMGAIGMTYEQAGHGRAGLGIDTDEGYELTLVDRVAHHNTTGLSTVEISSRNAARLNEEFRNFFNDNSGMKYKSYVLNGHPDKIAALAALLDRHEIRYGYGSGGSVSGFSYTENGSGSVSASGALIVSTNQPKGKMVKVLFDPDAKLSTPLTYDITAWSIPHAYGLECVASTSLVSANGTAPIANVINQVVIGTPGYILPWNSMQDAAFLSDLLANDVKVRFSEKDLSFAGRQFKKGSLVITKSDNRQNPDFDALVTSMANKHGRALFASPTSFSDNGTDFGSPDIKLVPKNRIAVLKGDGTSSLSYGATWHYFETQLNYPITSIDTDDFSTDALANFDILVMPSGWYGRMLNGNNLDGLKSWIRDGGKVIAIGGAAGAFEGKDGFGIASNETSDDEDEDSSKLLPYDQREQDYVKNMITGAIYQVSVDNTHPMAFGYDKDYFSLKLGGTSYKLLDGGFNVGHIGEEPNSVSGFSGEKAKAGLKNSLVFGEQRMGRGSVVYLVDDVLFRSFWENGKLFMANSIFFVNSNVFRL
ncbi:M14 family metallopeptidase [Aureitalea marina]|uniref:Zinc carboxypeptidase n=1 Tax=Aureitalea marina TaxID=930804 RepID=A0A2S7KQ69_9FLAO|nr:M14 family metallopeptidase [Aureitalea marina]PQB04765.1 zinc carboxypeptidase [Aureitalea marina]